MESHEETVQIAGTQLPKPRTKDDAMVEPSRHVVRTQQTTVARFLCMGLVLKVSQQEEGRREFRQRRAVPSSANS